MKKLSLIILMLVVATMSFGQLNSNRTANTRISDALALLPADNAVTLEQAMSDLFSAGSEGMNILTAMFTDVRNVPVNYALNGLAFYLMAPDRGIERETFQGAVITALGKATDTDVKRFYLYLLSIVGSDSSVETVSEYIADGELYDYALHTLASINTQTAKYAVKTAMAETNADRGALALTGARMEIPGIYPFFTEWLGNAAGETRSAILSAMALTGEPKAVSYFASAAKADKYAHTQNTVLYVEALNNYMKVNPSDAAKKAKDLMSKAKKADNKILMLSAFQVYADAGGKDLTAMVVDAMDDTSRQYRNGVLGIASQYADELMIGKLFEKADKSNNPEMRADVIRFAQNNSKYGLGYSEKYLLDPDDVVAVEAINTFYADRSYPIVTAMMNIVGSDRSDDVIGAARDYLIAQSNDAVQQSDGARHLELLYGNANPYGKAALLQIIGSKMVKDYMPLVVASLGDGNSDISSGAYGALAGVVSGKDLPLLFTLLDETLEEVGQDAIRKAIMAAAYDIPAAERVQIYNSRMAEAPERSAYYTLLASTGDKAAFQLLEDEYKGETPTGKTEIVNALALGNDPAAAEHLFNIVKADGSQFALRAYISTVAKSGMKAERKYTMLLKASEKATDTASKLALVTELGKLPIFQSLILLGDYLEEGDAKVRDIAAQGVMNIALTDTDWNGPVVVDLLKRARAAVNNPDAEYNRQAIDNHLAELAPGEGFISIFNGKDLTGWKGIVENPIARAKMSGGELSKKQDAANALMRKNWTVENGALVYIGDGYDNIATVKDYGDIEMYLDWRLYPEDRYGDGDVYLRGVPQVQIWDTDRDDQPSYVGSGGLYNNMIEGSDPLVYADNPTGEWNTFRIVMKGERVSVWLNGELVVNNVVLENYWDRKQPLFPTGQIELQGHTTRIAHKNIYVKELPMAEPYVVSDEERAEGFVELFDGLSLDKWYGNTHDYVAEDGSIVLYPSQAFGGNLYTKEEFGDFVLRFEFQLTPAANNGIGIRTPDEGDAAYVGMEIQILDDRDPVYATIADYQSHGSVYGVIAAKRDCLKPVGEWNVQEIYANGNHIRVTLNGVVILDGDIAEASKNGTLDGLDHPGLENKSGHIAFLGHGSKVKFRNLRIKRLD